jgi:hypothetical protein
MQVGQKTIVRWISKRVAKRGEVASRQSSCLGLRELTAEQLRHVSGGSGGMQSPGKTW